MTMLSLIGPAAETDFRLSKLLQRLQLRSNVIQDVSVNFVHFVHSINRLSDSDIDLLKALLTYGKKTDPTPREGTLYVVPRLGTITPWASKATNIAHICGLPIQRLERGCCYRFNTEEQLDAADLLELAPLLHDRMTETVLSEVPSEAQLFAEHQARSFDSIDLSGRGVSSLEEVNSNLGLALSEDEVTHLAQQFKAIRRNPTDVELMMFGQVNSEHCRHKIFNANWVVDGKTTNKSLFQMIKNTHACASEGVLSAYKDNAAVVEGPVGQWFVADPESALYGYRNELLHLVMKVETHNHPTAISPFPGAATGSGGEIRDEGATGRGAKPKAGLTGFTVSHLEIPDFFQPWEAEKVGRPGRIASPLSIMLDGPIGAAQFNNEFGRPNLSGYFRTYLFEVEGVWRGYHKPIMITGGVGNILDTHVEKEIADVGTKLIVLGGPSMLIGLGGGAASSKGSGSGEEDLDFASVQRGNPEIQRRAQEVIESCMALADQSPITSIHDIGAGGLSNAVPEIVEQSHRGALIELREIPSDESGMTPMEIWCNEAQERYMLAVPTKRLPAFEAICERERCPYAIIGELTETRNLEVTDAKYGNSPVSISMDMLFGSQPNLTCSAKFKQLQPDAWNHQKIAFESAVEKVLKFPAVADKSFLIHIGDRTVGGMTARDQLVGPWQVPVSDVAVTTSGFTSYTGEAMAMGERTPIATYNGSASVRLAVTEAVTNIAAADVLELSDIRLSANWMAATGHQDDDGVLYDMVKTMGEDFCPALGIAVPVGKDSLSMRTAWEEQGKPYSVTAPVSVIVSAFAPVADVRRTLTPELRMDTGKTSLLLIDLSSRQLRLGGSSLAQVHDTFGGQPPDLDDPKRLVQFFKAQRRLREEGLVLAYHDRSDGGLLTTLTEMALTARVGLKIEISSKVSDVLAYLFSEEPGVVIQVRSVDLEQILDVLGEYNLGDSEVVAEPTVNREVVISHGDIEVFKARLELLQNWWSELTFRMQALRDNPECAREAYEDVLADSNPGLSAHLNFKQNQGSVVHSDHKPKVAILREQGVNSHREMAAAFHRAGFEPYDVHMSDLFSGKVSLDQYRGLVACGGFSYGDVLGAGEGWAKSILYNESIRHLFGEFFARDNIFALGVCNGCQMLAALKELIPGTGHWPRFVRNRSDQFEARFSMVRIDPSPSILLAPMAGSRLPIVTSHGEGLAEFASTRDLQMASQKLVSLTYIDNHGETANRYPANPNGSPLGIAGLSNEDGRVTIMMPHPERCFRTVQHSWHPADWGEDSPWQQLFFNARDWL